MAKPYLEQTSPTLLGRIAKDPKDEVAWATFVDCYGPKINHGCRQRGLQQADAEDVTQNVLLRLARVLKTFNYEPSKKFRGWLRQVTAHVAVTAVFKAKSRVLSFIREKIKRLDSGSG